MDQQLRKVASKGVIIALHFWIVKARDNLIKSNHANEVLGH